LFSQGISEYLKGNWFEAERHFREILKHDRQDAEAHLMLATLFRHTGRPAEARQKLSELKRLPGGPKWELEIQREWEASSAPARAAGQGVPRAA
jgi:Flp pilus assembly protein TadD